MSDTCNEPQFPTPWPYGPWKKGVLGENQFDVYDADGESIIEPSDRAEFVSHETAELVALAPEMAEAILADQFCTTGNEALEAAVALREVALKLRAIGGAS